MEVFGYNKKYNIKRGRYLYGISLMEKTQVNIMHFPYVENMTEL
jgi:hypothetical protein